MIEGSLADHLAAEKYTETVQILEAMRTLLLAKHSPKRDPNPLTLPSPIMHSPHNPRLHTQFSQIADSLIKPLEMANEIKKRESTINTEEAFLNTSKSKSIQQKFQEDHNKEILRLEEKQKALEKRNGELSREMEVTPDKKIQELEKQIQACSKQIESMSQLLVHPEIKDDDKALMNAIKVMNENISKRDQLKIELEEVKRSKSSHPENLAKLKKEQENIRAQMIQNKALIKEMKAYPMDKIISIRKERLEEQKAELNSKRQELRDNISALQKMPNNNEVRALFTTALTKMDELVQVNKRPKLA